MLTGLKVSSLTCKYVFYRPELKAKAGAHGIEFCKPWNIPIDKEHKEYKRKMGSFV